MTEAQYAELVPVVHAIARNSAPWPLYDDAVSCGWIAALERLEHYDASRGVYLRRYVSRAIQGAIFQFLKQENPIHSQGGPVLRRMLPQFDPIALPRLGPVESAAEAASLLSRAELNCRERSILHAHYWGERDGRQIARTMGISQQRFSQLLAAAKRKLRAASAISTVLTPSKRRLSHGTSL